MISGKLDFRAMRDCKKFGDDGIKLSLTSDIAAKYFDSLIFQSYGFFEAQEVNGAANCIKEIYDLDPNFPLVKLFSIDGEPNPSKAINDLTVRYNRQMNGTNAEKEWTKYERMHVKAFILNHRGYNDSAADIWNELITLYPNDVFGLKNLNVYYIIKGIPRNIANSSGYCRIGIKPESAYYPFVIGYEAFGLEEQGHFSQARKLAMESLSRYEWNSWATHTLSHVHESLGEADLGLEMLEQTRDHWMSGTGLQCHNLWHEALMHLNSDKPDRLESALSIWDNEIVTRLKPDPEKTQMSMFELSDAISLLTRISILQTNHNDRESIIKSRWLQLHEQMSHSPTHWMSLMGMCFYDSHQVLAAVGCNRHDVLNRMREQIELTSYHGEEILDKQVEMMTNFKIVDGKLVETTDGNEDDDDESSCKVHYLTNNVCQQESLLPFVRGATFYEQGEYSKCASVLYPVRDKLRFLGGSLAQNDVYNQVLCHSLLMSGSEEDMGRLRRVLYDRSQSSCHEYKSDTKVSIGGGFQRYMIDQMVKGHHQK